MTYDFLVSVWLLDRFQLQRDHLHVDRLDSRPPPLHIRGPVPRRETNHVREVTHSPGGADLDPKWVRLTPNGTNL